MPCPRFGLVQNVLVIPKLVWTGPKCFGSDPKQLFTTEFHILNHVKMFSPVQNNLPTFEIVLDI